MKHLMVTPNFITLELYIIIVLYPKGTIRDVYNVPCDSDIYTLPVDTVRPKISNIFKTRYSSSTTNDILHTHSRQAKKQAEQKSTQRKRRRNTSACEQCCDPERYVM